MNQIAIIRFQQSASVFQIIKSTLQSRHNRILSRGVHDFDPLNYLNLLFIRVFNFCLLAFHQANDDLAKLLDPFAPCRKFVDSIFEDLLGLEELLAVFGFGAGAVRSFKVNVGEVDLPEGRGCDWRSQITQLTDIAASRIVFPLTRNYL